MRESLSYSPAGKHLENRVILVTGASDGLGRAVAKGCAALGATVILLGKTQAKLERVYDEIDAAHPAQATLYPCNLADATAADFKQLAAALEGEFGRLDGLIHNAAWLGEMQMLAHYELSLWDKVMRINLTAPLLLTQSCLGLLKRSEDASVIFTLDQRLDAYWGAYAVSKAALIGLMRLFAEELEVNTPIRVNAVDPGPIRTRLRSQAYPGQDPRTWPDPATRIRPYLFLAGDDSKQFHQRLLRPVGNNRFSVKSLKSNNKINGE